MTDPQLSAEWLRVTLGSIGDAVITTDTDGRVTFLNPVAEHLTGWSRSDASGQPLETVFEIINEDSRRTVENPATRALRDGVVVGLANHTLLISRDGSERPIDDSAAPIRSTAGEVAGVVLVFRDVTDRRAHEHALRDSLNYARNVVATLRHPFVVLEKGLRVQSANRSFYRVFQVTPEQTEGSFLYDLGNRQWDIPELRELLERILPENTSFDDYEVQHTFLTIGPRNMLLNARRMQQDGDGSELILLAIEDVTDRRRAESLVLDSEVRYRRLFETAQDAILILDARTGAVTDANPFVANLLKYSREELVGKQLWELGVFKDKQAALTAFKELQDKGYIRYEHLPLETKYGTPVDVEFVSNVYEVDHHSVIQCNIRDITDRVRLEKQVADQAESLADLNRRKDEFLAMLSHELRNPLAPIANAVQLLALQQKNENSIQEQARTIIERQLGQLSHLVDDLLEVSRIATGRVRLHLERVTLAPIVTQSVEAVRPIIAQRGHELTVSIPPEPMWLNADAVRLEQIIVNLLNNAAKYTDEGGHIWLTVHREGNDAILRVRDTGVGITPELLPHVFDLFTQERRSLDRSQGGLGIGLALVDRLVEMHEGTIEVHSSLGKGSEFIVRLPMVSPDKPASDSPPVEVPQPVHRSLRVLVVDDNVDAAKSLAMLLTIAGHRSRAVHSGADALEAILDYQPEVVLLDIGLPGMDGYEVAQRIRMQSSLDKVVIVGMTGYGQEEDQKKGREAGFDHHLVKPADFKKLKEILAAVAKE